MENTVEKFDPSKLMEGVKDRIKATFVSLIPDDAWEQMLEKEIYIFTTGRIIPHHDIDYSKKDKNGNYVCIDWEERIPYSDSPIYDDWGHIKTPAEISPLRRMIRDTLQERFQQDLKEFLEGEEYQSTFNSYGKPEISRAIKEILVKNAGTIFESFLANILQNGFENLRYYTLNKLQSGNYSY